MKEYLLLSFLSLNMSYLQAMINPIELASNLHAAIIDGNIIKVQDILNQAKEELDEENFTKFMFAKCDNNNISHLNLAVANRNISMVTKLINTIEEKLGNKGIIELFSKKSTVHYFANTLLCEVTDSMSINMEILKTIVTCATKNMGKTTAEYNNFINAQNEYGTTALHYAVRANDLRIITYLLENGARKDIIDAEGKTPLDFAKEYNLLTAQHVLENYGSYFDNNIIDLHTRFLHSNNAQEAFNILKTINNDKMLKMLIFETNINFTDLLLNFIRANSSTIREFFDFIEKELGAEALAQVISKKDDNGQTALHYALKCENYPAAKVIIEYAQKVMPHKERLSNFINAQIQL